MKKLGTIDISFKELKDDIYYYNLSVTVGAETKKITLPRYDVFLGWIEIFGLPPQNEWVVLADLADFTKSATLTIGGVDISETVVYKKDTVSKNHQIKTTRTGNGREEICSWTQDYTEAPHNIISKIIFEHAEGIYTANWKTAVLDDASSLTPDEVAFYQKTIALRGVPDLIIKKTFAAHGSIPPLYYSLFPITEIVNLSDTTGSLLELGYLKKDSEHRVDQVHGDWFKRFDNGEQVLRIIESNYSSCTVEVAGVNTCIKDTYRKELYLE